VGSDEDGAVDMAGTDEEGAVDMSGTDEDGAADQAGPDEDGAVEEAGSDDDGAVDEVVSDEDGAVDAAGTDEDGAVDEARPDEDGAAGDVRFKEAIRRGARGAGMRRRGDWVEGGGLLDSILDNMQDMRCNNAPWSVGRAWPSVPAIQHIVISRTCESKSTHWSPFFNTMFLLSIFSCAIRRMLFK
jgi:hypothetical protein